VPALDPALLERLRAPLRCGPPLRLAALFGSRATGTEKPDSDFDIGIVPADPTLTLHEELALAAALSGAVDAEVDLVRLDGEDLLLGREVAQTGVCLLEDSPGVFAAYRATAMSRWMDWDETLAPHQANFLRRLARARP
jgi:predicted nucleotidyltransferase